MHELDTLAHTAGGMNPFTYDQLPARIVFGAGRLAEVGAEVERLGGQRVMLISDWAGRSAGGRGDVGSSGLGWRWPGTRSIQHVPVDLAERARAAATDASIDCVVCIGGGSSTGLAKAMALSHAVPIVAVPTTYAGSEQTTIYGLTGGRHKETGKNPIVQPKTVVYDPELTVGLPAQRDRPFGVQRARPFGRGAVRARQQSDHVGAGARRRARDSRFAADGDGVARRRRSPRHLAVRRVPLRVSRSAPPPPGCTTSCATCWVAGSTWCTPTRTR